MSSPSLPAAAKSPKLKKNQIQLVASGDLRQAANERCWPAQLEMEQALGRAVTAAGFELVRAHPFKSEVGHGFIGSQKEGMEVFRAVDADAPLIVAEAVWQYSHHVLAGLISHRGPILTVANWSGTWPGLVGMLNLNGSLTKAGVKYSTLWSEDFAGDAAFLKNLKKWLTTGRVRHRTDHVTPLELVKVPKAARRVGVALAEQLLRDKAIMGVFDEGCMGMFNAIIPDDLLHATGVYKERLSQSALYYETTQVSDAEAQAVRRWMEDRGMKFVVGHSAAGAPTGGSHSAAGAPTGGNHSAAGAPTGGNCGDEHLTDDQIHRQCQMYIAAVRIADDFGCHTIGIQYQQGLKDLLPASDLVEGTLNNADRPPVFSRDGRRELYAGAPLPHFNEVDECAGLDGLMTYRLHKALGQPVENTLHDLRWGDWDRSGTVDDYVWVFLISGSAPPAHFIGGWSGASSERQPAMYFRLGGGTLKGVSRPGEIVWSRIYVQGGRLRMDLGRAGVVDLPDEETNRRWQATTPQWPIMHAVTYGITRDQMMAQHQSNHIQVVYATDERAADECCLAKAAMAERLGMEVAVCGTRKGGKAWARR